MDNYLVRTGFGSILKNGEIVLLIVNENKRGKWIKLKVVGHVKMKGGFVRGVTLLHKGRHDQKRSLLCPLEIKAEDKLPVEETKRCDNYKRRALEGQLRKNARKYAQLQMKISFERRCDYILVYTHLKTKAS